MAKVEEIGWEREVRHFSGLIFVACMFIGGGLGLAFNRPDVGGAIGMGVGFLLMGLIRIKSIKPSPITLTIPKSFGNIFLSFLGLIIIFIGVSFLLNLDYQLIFGFGFVALGLLILLAGLIGYERKV